MNMNIFNEEQIDEQRKKWSKKEDNIIKDSVETSPKTISWCLTVFSINKPTKQDKKFI